jgi:hypothetical protein
METSFKRRRFIHHFGPVGMGIPSVGFLSMDAFGGYNVTTREEEEPDELASNKQTEMQTEKED